MCMIYSKFFSFADLKLLPFCKLFFSNENQIASVSVSCMIKVVRKKRKIVHIALAPKFPIA